MRTISKTGFLVIVLAWISGAEAGEVAVSEQDGAIVLESVGMSADAVQAVSSPAISAAPSTAQSQPAQAAPPASRVTVKAYTEKVDRARIEKRMEDRALRTKKRALDAEKDATERAAKAQLNQLPPQEQGVQNGQ